MQNFNLDVKTSDKSNVVVNKITIVNDRGHSKEELERMVSDAERYRKQDVKQRERLAAINSLQSYCFNVKSTATELSDVDKTIIIDKCDEIINWLDVNDFPEEEEIERKKEVIERLCSLIVKEPPQGSRGTGPPSKRSKN